MRGRRAESSHFSLGTINFEMPVRFQAEMLSRWSDRASSARGVAKQEMKMWKLSAGGGLLVQETGREVLRSQEREEKKQRVRGCE